MEAKFNLSKEDNIILACAAQALDEKTRIDIINKIRENKLDWEYILKKASLNRISSLLYQNLKSIHREYLPIPHKVWGSLKDTYIVSALQNMRLLADLAKLLKAFKEARVKVMVIKGAVLMERIYKDIALRAMLDIDIVVQEKDFSAVKDIFKRLDYTTEDEDFDPVNRSPVPLDYHIAFLNKNGTNIEVKFCLWGLDFPDFETEKMWKEAEMVRIADQETLIPSPEYSLLIICVGLIRQAFTGLIWYCDIKEIINFYKDRLNWERLVSLAKDKRVDVLTFYGLFFAQRLINANVPDTILGSLRPSYLKKEMFELLWNKEAILNLKEEYVYQRSNRLYIPHEAKMIIFCGKMDFRLNRLSKLLGYILRAIFPPRPFLANRYLTTSSPIRLFFYHYILRLSRYLARVLRSIFLLILRKCGF